MKTSRVLRCLAFGVFMAIAAAKTHGAAEWIVWDFGPDTGLATPPEGNRSVWVNASDAQNFTDSVVFTADTTIVGFNLFTSSSRLPPYGVLAEHFRIRFLLDQGGVPGAVFAEREVTSPVIEFVGDYRTVRDEPADIYRISLRFSPVTLTADAIYWVGATGVNVDAGQYGVVGPGDSSMAQMFGPDFSFIVAGFGDQMFQLVGLVSGPMLLEQMVPCAGPTSGGTWKNHGAYVSAFGKAARQLLSEGMITRAEAKAAKRAAARSDCGKK